MTLCRAAFNTYEVIVPHNVHLGDDNVAKAITIKTIILETNMKGNVNRICIKDACT